MYYPTGFTCADSHGFQPFATEIQWYPSIASRAACRRSSTDLMVRVSSQNGPRPDRSTPLSKTRSDRGGTGALQYSPRLSFCIRWTNEPIHRRHIRPAQKRSRLEFGPTPHSVIIVTFFLPRPPFWRGKGSVVDTVRSAGNHPVDRSPYALRLPLPVPTAFFFRRTLRSVVRARRRESGLPIP